MSMSTQSLRLVSSPSVAGFGARAWGLPARLLAHVVKHLRRRKALRDLQKLDDRTLKDIGVSRGQLDHLINQPFHTDLSAQR